MQCAIHNNINPYIDTPTDGHSRGPDRTRVFYSVDFISKSLNIVKHQDVLQPLGRPSYPH